MNRTHSLKIAVIAGGTSAEREVSLQGGQQVQAALESKGYQVIHRDPAHPVWVECDWTGIDLAFLVLHGEFGEDGQVQRFLEDKHVPYTGSNADASELAFRKSAAKERFKQHGVPTLPAVLIHQSDTAARIHQHAEAIGYPLIVKPDTQGSSLGVSLVQSPEELPAALTACFHLGEYGLIETAVTGSEWTVSLLDDHVFPLIQIVPQSQDQLFDYEAKYHSPETSYQFETEAELELVRSIREVGHAAARAVGTSGLARVDVMLDRHNQPWVLEVNTIPGMTDHSLVPMAASQEGISFAELCEQAVHSAIQHEFNTTTVWKRAG